MSTEPVRIKRYPNRRYYATHTSRYISLPEIEQLIRNGATVEIVDSQTGEDLTRPILVQIIAEMHPEKIALFPSAMLHSMLRANKVMAEFLQAYFRASLTHLEQLQKHGAAGSFMLGDRGARMLDGEFEPVRSALDIFVKDMGLVVGAAKARKLPTPLAAAAEQLYLAGSAEGLGRRDDSSLVTLYERWAGRRVSGESVPE